jgi:plastocyanin
MSRGHGAGTGILIAAALLARVASGEAAYRESAVTNGARIVGTVRVAGTVTSLPPQPVFKEQEFCGETITDDRLVIGRDGGLAGAVAHLRDIDAGKPVAHAAPVRLDNRKCAFVPHVVVASVGDVLEMHNEDPFLHDAHAWLGTDTLFNVAIPKGRTVHHVLDRAGIAHVNCNVRHTWMHAYVFVTEDPFRVVTDGNGRFVLDDVPPGTHTITVWHEMLGSQERQVTVGPGETATVNVEFEAHAPEAP